jgi:anti-sigma B factor antagonist
MCWSGSVDDRALTGRNEDQSVLFDVQVARRNGWIVLAVGGDLDLASAPPVRQAVLQALSGSDAPDTEPRIVLDLSLVDFIDSTGLGVVLGAVRRVRAAGGLVRVVATEPQVQVRRAFSVTKLDRILPLACSVDEAIAAAGPRPRAREEVLEDG